MEGDPNQIIIEALKTRLEEAKQHAVTYDRFKELNERIGELSSDDKGHSAEIALLEAEINKGAVSVETISDFSALLHHASRMDEGLSNEQVQSVLAHENAHAIVAQTVGANHEGYTLLVLKDEDRFIYTAWVNFTHPDSWLDEEGKVKDLIKVFAAPKTYGDSLSEADILKIRDLVARLKEIKVDNSK
jgi:hypothetical protein